MKLDLCDINCNYFSKFIDCLLMYFLKIGPCKNDVQLNESIFYFIVSGFCVIS